MKPVRSAQDWVSSLHLVPLPDGGFYRETYRSAQQVVTFTGGVVDSYVRSAGTAILYLMPRDAFQAFHQLAHDEMWHWYAGSPCQLHLLHPATRRYELVTMGPEPNQGHRFQAMIPASTWFAAEVEGEGDYTLAGCTVAPGFDWGDFHLADAEQLTLLFPAHRELIERLIGKRKA